MPMCFSVVDTHLAGCIISCDCVEEIVSSVVVSCPCLCRALSDWRGVY